MRLRDGDIRSPMTYRPLQDAVRSQKPAGFEFPLTHAATVLELDQILAEAKICPRPCDVFGVKLAYFYYGRMAYRVEPDADPSDDFIDGPIGLIFRADAVKPFEHVYPFDTGAFKRSFYRHATNSHRPFDLADLQKFELDDLEAARSLLGYFWRNAQSYYDFDVKEGLLPLADPTDPFAVVYAGILNGTRAPKGDDRRGTVEVCTSHEVAVTPATLAGIILPLKYMDNKRFKAIQPDLEAAGVLIRSYAYSSATRPIEWFVKLRETGQGLMESLGCWGAV